MTRYKNHPAADLFPMIEGKAWEDFKQDIRTNGFQQDITLYRGQILDGRNRYKAAIELKMLDDLGVCEFDEDSDIDPYQWVISRNLHRRHLTESQRASVAAKLVNTTRGGDRKSDEIKGQICTSIGIDKAAEMLQVSPRSVKSAKAVLEHGSPELIAAVERGEVAVSRAATVAKTTPKEKQVEVAKKKTSKVREQIRDKNGEAIKDKYGDPVTVNDQRKVKDRDWVDDFVFSMSRMNRLKLLLKEITDSERQILKDWLSER
jgi:ParB-like chromosome segregation protein Spo0J